MTQTHTNNTSIATAITDGDPDRIEDLSDILDELMDSTSAEIADFVLRLTEKTEVSDEESARIKKAAYEVLMEGIYLPIMMKGKKND